MPDLDSSFTPSMPEDVEAATRTAQERQRQQAAQRQAEIEGQRQQLQAQLDKDRQKVQEAEARLVELKRNMPPVAVEPEADPEARQQYSDWSRQVRSAEEQLRSYEQQYGATGQALQHLGEIPTKTAAQERKELAQAQANIKEAAQRRAETGISLATAQREIALEKTGVKQTKAQIEAEKKAIEDKEKAAAEAKAEEQAGYLRKGQQFIATAEKAEKERQTELAKLTLLERYSSYEQVPDNKKEEWVRQLAIRDYANVKVTLTPEGEKLVAGVKQGYEQKSALIKAVWEDMTPWVEEKGEKATAGGIALMAAELLVPGVYVGRRWNDLSPGERAAFIAIDALSLVPLVGVAGKAARGVPIASRTARLLAAGKAVGVEAGRMLIAPVEVAIHPLETTKSGFRELRNLAENIAHPHKIPEAVITTSEGTVRLRISETTSPEVAIKMRNEVMELVAKGEKPIIEVGGQTIELSRSSLMKEAGGGLIHTTPQGEIFREPLVVETKAGKPLSEQGLFLSNEPLPRFAESSAFGQKGEQSYIRIFSPEKAQEAIDTGKLYRNTAEMERKFPVGTHLEPPAQELYTRIGAKGTKVIIGLDKPLSKTQIATLKAKGLVEWFKTPFEPAIKVSGKVKDLTKAELEELNTLLRASGNRNLARNVERAYQLARTPLQLRAAIRTGARAEATRVTVELPRTQRIIAPESRAIPQRLESITGRQTRENREVIRANLARLLAPAAGRIPERMETREAVREPGRAAVREPSREPTREPARMPISEPVRGIPPREQPPREQPPRERPPREEPPRERPPREEPPKLPKDASDKEKRAYLTKVPGLVARRRGSLEGKSVWRIKYYPYGPKDKTVILGDPPAGAKEVRGPGSIKASAIVLRGLAPKKRIYTDTGAVDDIIVPVGEKKVTIESVRDRSISSRPGRISERSQRRSGRNMRISPRMPKLR